MDWSAFLVASFLAIATCGLCWLVDRLRKGP